MSFLSTPVTLTSLPQESQDKLAKVPDYPLDYNIFLFKGIAQAREDDKSELVSFRKAVLDSIPADYGDLVFKGLTKTENGYELEQTTTSRLQERLLKLLILERHRRDIVALNKLLAASRDTTSKKKQIQYVQLNEPLKYEIKSPLYKSLEGVRESYLGSFKKFAMLQNVEYDFEHTIDENGDYQSDEDLVNEFCKDEVMAFNEALTSDKDLEDVVANTKIAQVLIPLAAQSFFSEEDEEK